MTDYITGLKIGINK